MRCKRKTGWYVLLMSQMNVDIIGIIIIFVVAMGAPLLINGLSAWVTA